MMSRRGTFTVVFAVACLTLAGVSAPVLGATVPGEATDGNDDDPSRDVSSAVQSSNNSTTHHVNPDNTSQEGDLIGVRGWLTGRLSERLTGSAIRINQQQYEAGRELIGDDYDDRLGQLVDVVGETGSGDDDEFGESFSEVRRTQKNYSEAAQEYNETYEDYREAVRNGNETEARRQARRLNNIEDRIQRLNGTLADRYRRLENQTGRDFTTAITAIANHTRNVSTRQAELEEELFTETSLTLTADAETIAYDDPLVAHGRLTTADGMPLSNQEIALRVHTRTRRVQTDEMGRFTFRYRPRTIPANATTLSVEYVPENESVYLGSSATVPVEIEPVEANLSIRSAPTSLSFADALGFDAQLTLGGEPVTGVPLSARLGGYRPQVRRTNENGVAAIAGSVPASLLPGETEIAVSLALEDRAVQASTTRAETTTESTATTLTVRGERAGEDSVLITGRLRSEDGTPVPAQTLQVDIEGGPRQTVETSQNGTYSLGVEQSALPDTASDEADVTVTFDGQGTNLESESVAERVEFASFEPGQSNGSESGPGDDPTSGQSDGPGSDPGDDPTSGDGIIDDVTSESGLLDGNVWYLFGGVVAVVAVVTLGVIAYRKRTGISKDVSDRGSPVPRDEVVDETPDERFGPASISSLITDGRSDAAVRYAYHYVRDSLGPSIGVEDSDTHWEFFAKCQDSNIDRARVSALRNLVEAYERVQFYEGQDLDLDLVSLLEDIETG